MKLAKTTRITTESDGERVRRRERDRVKARKSKARERAVEKVANNFKVAFIGA